MLLRRVEELSGVIVIAYAIMSNHFHIFIYLSDLGFYFATNTDNRINYGPVLENAVYIYARTHGCSVSIGRIGAHECDFVFRHGDADYAYAQVAMTIMADKATEDREYAPLERIRDNYPKFVLTRNDPILKRNGIVHENLPDFMKQGRDFGLS